MAINVVHRTATLGQVLKLIVWMIFTKSRIFVHSVLGLCYTLAITFSKYKRTLFMRHLEANVLFTGFRQRLE